MKTRTEKDTMGTVEVPADKYWGAQTQRSKMNFRIQLEAAFRVWQVKFAHNNVKFNG